MKWKSLFLVTFLSLSTACASQAVSSGHSPYPEDWWKPVPKEDVASWEVPPQQAGPHQVVVSKRTELGILSNFADTPFEFEGKLYASVEGFWQMLKYPEGPHDERLKNPNVKWEFTREQVGQMTGFDAKAAGSKANANMKTLKIEWVTYNGKKINYLENAKGDFYKLIVAVEWMKVRQNKKVQDILLSTGDLELIPDHFQTADSAPAWKYCTIWMEIRSQLLADLKSELR